MSIRSFFPLVFAFSLTALYGSGCAVAPQTDAENESATAGEDALNTRSFIGTWRTHQGTPLGPKSRWEDRGSWVVSPNVPSGLELRIHADGSYSEAAYVCDARGTNCKTDPESDVLGGTWKRGPVSAGQAILAAATGLPISKVARPLLLNSTTAGVQTRLFAAGEDSVGLPQSVSTSSKGFNMTYDEVYSRVSEDSAPRIER